MKSKSIERPFNYIGKLPALPGDSKSLTAPYFETLIKALTNTDLFGAGPCGDRKRLIGFCPRKSAFKTGVTSPTALSGSNLSSRLCRRYLTRITPNPQLRSRVPWCIWCLEITRYREGGGVGRIPRDYPGPAEARLSRLWWVASMATRQTGP